MPQFAWRPLWRTTGLTILATPVILLCAFQGAPVGAQTGPDRQDTSSRLPTAGIPRTNALHWSESVGGLQLAVLADATNSLVHCWIRNGTTNPVEYNDFYPGYFEDVRLEIQEGTNWLSLPPGTFPGFGNYSSAGPVAGKIERLEAGQIATNTYSKRRYPASQRDLATQREKLLAEAIRGDTFAVDLLATPWPTGVLDRGSLQARITQSIGIGSKDNPQMVTLSSPAFSLDGPLIASRLDRKRNESK